MNLIGWSLWMKTYLHVNEYSQSVEPDEVNGGNARRLV